MQRRFAPDQLEKLRGDEAPGQAQVALEFGGIDAPPGQVRGQRAAAPAPQVAVINDVDLQRTRLDAVVCDVVGRLGYGMTWAGVGEGKIRFSWLEQCGDGQSVIFT